MPERLTQSDRLARLSTSLGTDVLVLLKLEAYEAISTNYEWRVECLLNDGEDPVEPGKIIGTQCSVELDTPSGLREFPGICTEVRFRGWRNHYMLYELVLRPRLWLLTCETRSRVWFNMSVSDILKTVIQEYGITLTLRLAKGYDALEYVVQYQETNYAFISRLMEQHGIFFFFKYAGGKQELVLVDQQTSLPDIPEYGALRFQPDSRIGIFDDRLLEWETESRLRPSVVDLHDWQYERTSKVKSLGNAADHPKHSFNELKLFRYPGAGHDGPPLPRETDAFAQALIGAERAEASRKFARGYAPLIHSGGVFTLAEHPVDAENDRHIAIAARHWVSVNYYLTGGTEADSYHGEYEVAEAARVYKAPMKTPWPRIHGAQTATVVVGGATGGSADDEIAVDDTGRIWVKFHWNDAADDQRSCPVRVAQLWASSGWGSVWIPRIGMEVVVEFLDGDPNRPLVTGAVYNSTNKPPVAFPAEKTRSTIKSNSNPKGGGFNELRFEDKKDDEEIYIHAERDRLMEIEHDDDIIIGNNQTEKIGGSRTFELTGGDETITLKGAPGTKDKYGKVITKSGHRTTTLETGDETLTLRKGNQTVTLDMGNQTTTLKMGDQSTKMNLGKGYVEAMQSYEIKVGSSSIKLDQMGVTIKGMTITIDATMKLDAKGMMTTVQGTAMLMLKGGMVMIN